MSRTILPAGREACHISNASDSSSAFQTRRHRSRFRHQKHLLITGLTSASLVLSACGGGDQSDQTELRFAWWGSDTRHQLTQEAIETFEEEHPDISIEAEFGDWEGYWDQLATQVAANDAPDVIQMDEQFLREYADRDALLGLEEVDVSHMDETVVENGQVDGETYAITAGINSYVLVANPELFEEAGVEMPDDETWSWDDFAEVTSELNENLDDAWAYTGPQGHAMFMTWLRQHGQHLSDADSGLGFDVEAATSYFEHFEELMATEGAPPADLIQEDHASTLEQKLFASGEAAMVGAYSNEVVALSEMTGVDLELLRLPSPDGTPEGAAPWYKSGQYFSASAGTEHPEEAQMFIDFLVNSEEAAEILQAERGLPANEEMRNLVAETLEGVELASSEYIDAIEPDLGEAEPITTPGGATFDDIIERYETEVFFGDQEPAEAAEAMYTEMNSTVQ